MITPAAPAAVAFAAFSEKVLSPLSMRTTLPDVPAGNSCGKPRPADTRELSIVPLVLPPTPAWRCRCRRRRRAGQHRKRQELEERRSDEIWVLKDRLSPAPPPPPRAEAFADAGAVEVHRFSAPDLLLRPRLPPQRQHEGGNEENESHDNHPANQVRATTDHESDHDHRDCDQQNVTGGQMGYRKTREGIPDTVEEPADAVLDPRREGALGRE